MTQTISFSILDVAILGYSNKLLRSHLAKAGDDIILAVDLKGDKGCRSVVNWDANSKKDSGRVASSSGSLATHR
jgi:selenophosphate synthetase-related protein